MKQKEMEKQGWQIRYKKQKSPRIDMKKKQSCDKQKSKKQE